MLQALWENSIAVSQNVKHRVSIIVQLLSCVSLFVTPWTAAHQASLSFIISQSLLKLMSIESVMPSNHLFLHHPLLLLPSVFPRVRVFPNESALRIRWPKYWSFSFSISPSSSGLVSFRIDWIVSLHWQADSLPLRHSGNSTRLLPSSHPRSHVTTD